MKRLLAPLILFSALVASGQRQYDTVFMDGRTPAQPANIGILEPAGYSSLTTADSLGALIFFVGAGEAVNDSTQIPVNGPMCYMKYDAWQGDVLLHLNTYHPLIVTVQISSAFPQPVWIIPIMASLRARYRIKSNSIVMAGVSAGGYASNEFATYQPTAGDFTYEKMVRAIVNVEGVKPDDSYGAGPVYPTKFTSWAQNGGSEVGFEQLNDGRDIATIVSTMNAARSGAAIYKQTDYGAGTHGYFNYFFGGLLSSAKGGDNTNQIPNKFLLGTDSMTVYQWAASMMDTSRMALTNFATKPKAVAGPPQQQQLPDSTATLTGTVIGSYTTSTWTCVTNPGSAVITSPHSLTSGVTGLSRWGNYVFKLVVTGTNGSDSSYVRINVLPVCNTAAPVRYNLSASGGGFYYPLATATQPWLGGDTLSLPRGHFTAGAIFGNMTGDPCRRLYIMGPDAGADTLNILRFDDHCQYISVIPNPRNPNPYSIYAYTIGGALANHFLLSYVYSDYSPLAGQGGNNMLWKRHIDTLPNGAIVPETIRGNYLMVALRWSHLILKNADGEAVYGGPSAPEGGDGQGPVGFSPVPLDSLEIDHVWTDSSGWDGIQTSGQGDGSSIHDCKVTHYGLANKGSQQCGIIVGSFGNTEVYNDTVINGTGNGLEVFGYGIERVHNNILDSCGRDGSTTGTLHGQATIFQNSNKDSVNTPPNPTQIVVYENNIILHPQTFGAIRIQNDQGTGGVDTIRNNNFCIPGETAGTYQAHYIFTSPTAVFTGNTLSTNCGLIPPTVGAGPDQTITLPTATVSLSGTATGNSGATISTTSWTQISGPNTAGITSASSLATAVTGLVQGTYVFQLSATDSNGLNATDQVSVVVQPAPSPGSTRSFFIFHRHRHRLIF